MGQQVAQLLDCYIMTVMTAVMERQYSDDVMGWTASDIFLLQCILSGLWPTQTPIHWVLGHAFCGNKQLGCEADY